MTDILENVMIDWLLTKTTLTSLVGTRIWKGSIEDVSGEPLSESGLSAIVLEVGGGDVPSMNSLGFPRANFSIYSDHSRNSAGDVTIYNQRDRMWTVFFELNRLLHLVSMEPVVMGTVKIINCFRGMEPYIDFDEDAKLPYLFVWYDVKVVY